MAIFRVLKLIWKDNVAGQIIAVAIVGAVAIIWDRYAKTPEPVPAAVPPLTTPAKLSAKTVPAIEAGGAQDTFTPVTLRLTDVTLKNLTYPILGQLIALRDGKREYVPDTRLAAYSEDGPIYADLADFVIGDLDGDGMEDAVVLLSVSGGGTGHFLYMVPVVNDHGTPQVLNKSYRIGDRVQLQSMELRNGRVTMKVVMQGPDDPLCCPTQLRTLRFTLQAGLLNCGQNECSEMNPEAAG